MALHSVCLQNVATPLVAPLTGRQQSSLLAHTASAPRAISTKASKAVRSEVESNDANDDKSNKGMTAATRLALIGYATATLAFGQVQPAHASPVPLRDNSVRVTEERTQIGLEKVRDQFSPNARIPNQENLGKSFEAQGGLFSRNVAKNQMERSKDIVADTNEAAAKGAFSTGSKPTTGPISTTDLGDQAKDAASDAQSTAGNLGEQAQGALSNLTGSLKGLAGQAEGNLLDLSNKAEGAKGQAEGALDSAKGTAQGAFGDAKNRVGGNLSGNDILGDAQRKAGDVASDAKSNVSGAGDQAQGVLSDITGTLKNLTGQAQGNLGGVGDKAEGVKGQAEGALDSAKGKAQGAFGDAKNRVGGNLSTDVLSDAKGRANSIVSKAGTLSKDILGNIRNAADSAQGAVQDAASGSKGGFGGLGGLGGLADQAKGTAADAQGTVKGFGGKAQGNLGGAGNAAQGLANQAKGSLSSTKRNAFNLANEAKKQAGSIQNSGDNVLSQAVDSVKNAIGQ